MIHAGWQASPFIDEVKKKDLDDDGPCKHPPIKIFTYPYPVKRQAQAGWLVHVCIGCDRAWID